MNRAALILMVLGLVIAGGTGLLMNQFLKGKVDREVVENMPAPKVETTEVLVAKRDLGVGTVLAPEDFRWTSWPSDVVKKGDLLITQEEGSKAAPGEAFTDFILRTPLNEGQPMQANMAFERGSASILAHVLSPGMRAVAIKVSASSAAAGLVVPGDRVDVLLSIEGGRLATDGSVREYIPMIATETIMESVKVLSADMALTAPEEGASQAARNLTLEVTPAHAELLVTASQLGDLSVSLNSFGDEETILARLEERGIDHGNFLKVGFSPSHGLEGAAGEAAPVNGANGHASHSLSPEMIRLLARTLDQEENEASQPRKRPFTTLDDTMPGFARAYRAFLPGSGVAMPADDDAPAPVSAAPAERETVIRVYRASAVTEVSFTE